MSRFGFLGTAILISAFTAASLHAASSRVQNIALRQADVTGGPRGPHPYLLKTVSTQKIVATGRDYQWSIGFPRPVTADSLRIIALRVEFNGGKKDTSLLKTGDGTFGMRAGGDPDEYARYFPKNNDTIYKYDCLPHDSLYFIHQLQATAGYFAKVSRGKLLLRATVYPLNSDPAGYAVPKPVLYYSPGGKKKEESWDDYYFRKTKGLMVFVRDALLAAAHDTTSPSPFANLHYNAADGTIRDENHYKIAFLIFHAGASYLTNGGKDGTVGRDTPGDMIDAFVNQSWFSMFKDSLHLSGAGVRVKGGDPDSLLISELMMCSETSNQDGLNWGIQGILVNQVARQLGMPDLFSTSSGESGVGAFCIMDFAGYSAGNGFIPPYPSAWIRAFMGWDNVQVASLGDNSSNPVKALTSVLDRDSVQAAASAGRDTTILLVPLNDHEYYLIENRQRNLTDNDSLFKYSDSAYYGTAYQRVVAAYPFNVNIDSNVLQKSTGRNVSKVILKVRNNDISLPASGVLVWHVDERVIRDRLAHDLLNADSVYRGISLVEADGINDIGVAFQQTFYQAVFYDYGGAEDVFPHQTKKSTDTIFSVNGFGPYTAPSTKSNDGGMTWLSLDIQDGTQSPRVEPSAVRNYVVNNFADSVFMVKPSWNYLVPGWPRLAAPDSFYDPVLADLDPAQAGREMFLLSKSGRFYAWATSADTAAKYNTRPILIDRLDARGDTMHAADTARCIDSLSGTFVMPSVIGNRVFIPTRDVGLRVLTGLSPTTWDTTISLGGMPSSYVCGYRADSSWAIGCDSGRLVFGKGLDTISSVKLPSNGAVCAIAALRDRHDTVAVIQTDGRLSLCTALSPQPSTSVTVDSSAVGPFTLATGDLDRDKASEIVVCDSRHGLWVYKHDLTLAPGWENHPSDWPSAYIDSATRVQAQYNRSKLPVNPSAPSLVDLNRDGCPDIIVGGTNGLYAFNYKNVLIDQWPAYLDNRFWFQRGSIATSPVVVMGPDQRPLVLFSSPTGERVTFRIAKIDSANPARGIIWFRNEANALDSLGNLSKGLVDTLLTVGDSLVTPFVIPGGFIDARNGSARRPLLDQSLMPSGLYPPAFLSGWPITTGSSPATSPLAGRVTGNIDTVDLFVPTTNGWVYRWRLPKEILPDSLFWPQTGYDNGRSFAYGGDTLPKLTIDKEPITFLSYPNPMKKSLGNEVVFKYQFSGLATGVRLDILTFTGFSVFSSSAMGDAPSHLTGSYPDFNEFRVPINKLGPGLYRCRMEATVNGKKSEKFWKLAITR